MSKLDVYIVIVTYNGMKWIDQCLSSCKGFQVIVIDNASTDNTVSYIKQQFPDVVLLPQKKNLGFGGGNNLGISYAYKNNADYVFLLNQDAYLQENTLNKLIKASQDNPEYGILSPIHLNGKGDKLDRNFSYYLSHDKNDQFYYDAINNSLNGIYDVPFVNAAAWLLPRNTLEVLGGFDPIFFHYGEDDNYCQRALFHNFKIGIIPNARICHDRESRTIIKITQFSNKYFKQKEKIYKYKFANINNDNWENELRRELQNLKKRIFKSILKLNLKQAQGYKKQITLLNNIYIEIKESREINKLKNPNYLNI